MLFVSLRGTVVRWHFSNRLTCPLPTFLVFRLLLSVLAIAGTFLGTIENYFCLRSLSATNSLLFRYYSRMILFIFVFSICTSRSIYLLRSFTSSSVLSPLQFPTSSPNKNCIDLGFRLCAHMYTTPRYFDI